MTQQTVCIGCWEGVGYLDDKDYYLFLLFIHYAGSTTFPVSHFIDVLPQERCRSDELEVICKRSRIKVYYCLNF